MQRIWIIGTTGSGKTTLGKNIAERLNIPAIDLDELHWLPAWKSVSTEEMIEAVNQATSDENWVISGNYTVTQRYLTRADTLIWLDYPFTIVSSQLLRRTFRRVCQGELCCNGNRETVRNMLSRDSILIWLLKTYWKRKRLDALKLVDPQYKHLQKHHFQRPRQTADWLKTLGNV